MGQRIPSYRLHKPSGRAVVTIAMQDHYLGVCGSFESRLQYAELIAQHAAGAHLNTKQAITANGTLTVYNRGWL